MRALIVAAIVCSAHATSAQAGLSVFSATDYFPYIDGPAEVFIENPGGRVSAILPKNGKVVIDDLPEAFKHPWTDLTRDPFQVGYGGHIRYGMDLDYFSLDPYYMQFYEGGVEYVEFNSLAILESQTQVWFRVWARYVPEPSALGLLAPAAAFFLRRRRRCVPR